MAELKLEDVMELLRESFMKHGDCESSRRYNGVPLSCTACMAKRDLKKLVASWEGRIVRLCDRKEPTDGR